MLQSHGETENNKERKNEYLSTTPPFDQKYGGFGLPFLADLPYYEELEVERITRHKQVAYITSNGDEEIEEVEDEESGYICRFIVSEIRKEPEAYEDLLTELNDDTFVLKKQYHAVQKYMTEIAAKQKHEDDNLLDLL